jgi:anti-sigma B factor antagonist
MWWKLPGRRPPAAPSPAPTAPTAPRERRPVAEPLRMSAADGLGHLVVAVAGELDAVTVPRFRDELMRQVPAAGPRLVVDLSGLRFMDTSAIHALVAVNNRVMDRGGLLVVAAAPPAVARVLTLAGADQVMPVVGSVAEAVALT